MTDYRFNDASSINQPLIVKPAPPKPDYEAAAASLMVTYGFGGHTPQPTSSTVKKKDKKKKEGKKSKR